MNIKCAFGFHDWDGCKCSKCGKTRLNAHAWDEFKCAKCGLARYSDDELKGKLHGAARNGEFEATRGLLKYNPHLVFSKDRNQWTPLHAAVDGNHKDVVAFLLANNAAVNAKDNNGKTPLHEAAAKGHKDVAELLADRADVNAKDNDGWSALMVASQSGHFDVVRALLSKGADVNARADDNRTPLILASQQGHLDIVQVLLANGADVNAKDNDRRTAPMIASEQGRLDVVEALLAKGAHVNAWLSTLGIEGYHKNKLAIARNILGLKNSEYALKLLKTINTWDPLSFGEKARRSFQKIAATAVDLIWTNRDFDLLVTEGLLLNNWSIRDEVAHRLMGSAEVNDLESLTSLTKALHSDRLSLEAARIIAGIARIGKTDPEVMRPIASQLVSGSSPFQRAKGIEMFPLIGWSRERQISEAVEILQTPQPDVVSAAAMCVLETIVKTPPKDCKLLKFMMTYRSDQPATSEVISRSLYLREFDLTEQDFSFLISSTNLTINRFGYQLLERYIKAKFDWRPLTPLFEHADPKLRGYAIDAAGAIEIFYDQSFSNAKESLRQFRYSNGSGELARQDLLKVGTNNLIDRVATTRPAETLELPLAFFWKYRANFDLESLALGAAKASRGMPVHIYRILRFLNTGNTVGAIIEGMRKELVSNSWNIDDWQFEILSSLSDSRRLSPILEVAENWSHSVHEPPGPRYLYFQVVRERIATAIGIEKSIDGRAYLAEALNSSSSDVRWVAATALGRAGYRDALAPLFRLYEREQQIATYGSESVAIAAARAMELLLDKGQGSVSEDLVYPLSNISDCPILSGEDPIRVESESLAQLRSLARRVH